MRSRFAIALFALAACGCAPSKAYVEADRLTYEAVAPEYLRYVEADPALSADQRQLRRDNVEAWAIRIRNAGGGK